jgi:hypothetical protein
LPSTPCFITKIWLINLSWFKHLWINFYYYITEHQTEILLQSRLNMCQKSYTCVGQLWSNFYYNARGHQDKLLLPVTPCFITKMCLKNLSHSLARNAHPAPLAFSIKKSQKQWRLQSLTWYIPPNFNYFYFPYHGCLLLKPKIIEVRCTFRKRKKRCKSHQCFVMNNFTKIMSPETNSQSWRCCAN